MVAATLPSKLGGLARMLVQEQLLSEDEAVAIQTAANAAHAPFISQLVQSRKLSAMRIAEAAADGRGAAGAGTPAGVVAALRVVTDRGAPLLLAAFRVEAHHAGFAVVTAGEVDVAIDNGRRAIALASLVKGPDELRSAVLP